MPEMEDIIHVGFFGEDEKFQVYLKPNDPIGTPCAHIRDTADNGTTIDVCIELLTGKSLFQNRKEIVPVNLSVQYDIFMEQTCNPYSSNYEKTLRLWNASNSEQIAEGLISVLCHDDPFLYLRICKEDSGLPIDLYVADGREYKRYGHPLWVYMNACLEETYYTAAWIPIGVDKKPSIAIGTYKTEVSGSDIHKVYAWIRLNRDLIVALSDDEISNKGFINAMRCV